MDHITHVCEHIRVIILENHADFGKPSLHIFPYDTYNLNTFIYDTITVF